MNLTNDNQPITHNFIFQSSPQKVYRALTSGEQIAKWWTTHADLLFPTEHMVGTFQWPSHNWSVKLRLENLQTNKFVAWKFIESNMQDTNAWVGSAAEFRLIDEPNGTRLNFVHKDYSSSPCKDVCTDGWKYVLGSSLKNFLETGKGCPYN